MERFDGKRRRCSVSVCHIPTRLRGRPALPAVCFLRPVGHNPCTHRKKREREQNGDRNSPPPPPFGATSLREVTWQQQWYQCWGWWRRGVASARLERGVNTFSTYHLIFFSSYQKRSVHLLLLQSPFVIFPKSLWPHQWKSWPTTGLPAAKVTWPPALLVWDMHTEVRGKACWPSDDSSADWFKSQKMIYFENDMFSLPLSKETERA